MDHKIVCWADYAIPVPVKAKWMARGLDRTWRTYRRKPRAGIARWIGLPVSCVSSVAILPPPEGGPWTEQLYWIGD